MCFGPLDVREAAPCDECGGDPEEIEHFRLGKHTYQRFEVFAGLELTLCNFCMVDFGSYDPTFFGLPRGSRDRFRADAFRAGRRSANRRQGQVLPCLSSSARISEVRCRGPKSSRAVIEHVRRMVY